MSRVCNYFARTISLPLLAGGCGSNGAFSHTHPIQSVLHPLMTFLLGVPCLLNFSLTRRSSETETGIGTFAVLCRFDFFFFSISVPPVDPFALIN